MTRTRTRQCKIEGRESEGLDGWRNITRKNRRRCSDHAMQSELGVSVIHHIPWFYHPDSVRSNTHFHRIAHLCDAAASSVCPDQTSSRRRGQSANGRQPSDAEDSGVRQRRVLRLLVADGRRDAGGVPLQLVQAVAGRRVCGNLARERQQRRQRVHLLVDQLAVPAPVRSARVTTLLFQIFPSQLVQPVSIILLTLPHSVSLNTVCQRCLEDRRLLFQIIPFWNQ